MTHQENGIHLREYKVWEKTKHQPYDYKKNGLLNHLVSNRIANTTNPILKNIINIYEKICIFVMDYAGILNNIHNFTKNNR